MQGAHKAISTTADRSLSGFSKNSRRITLTHFVIVEEIVKTVYTFTVKSLI